MSARTITVEASCSFEFEIDDEAVSEHDGAKILEVLEKRRLPDGTPDPDFYTPRATLDNLLGHLGIALAVEGRSMNIDGWADFPRDAATGSQFSVHWDIERVQVGEPE